jgi:hypothetical protein
VGVHTAYAIRSPLGSEESGVGCPRVVVGAAAQMASVCVRQRRGLLVHGSVWSVPETSDIGRYGCLCEVAVRLWIGVRVLGGVGRSKWAACSCFTSNQSPSLAGLVPAGRQLTGLQLPRTVIHRHTTSRRSLVLLQGGQACRKCMYLIRCPTLNKRTNELLDSFSFFLHLCG